MNWKCSRERAGGGDAGSVAAADLRGEEGGEGGRGGCDDENRHEPHEASPDGAGVPLAVHAVDSPVHAHTLPHK